jgi:hypothetical protein
MAGKRGNSRCAVSDRAMPLAHISEQGRLIIMWAKWCHWIMETTASTVFHAASAVAKEKRWNNGWSPLVFHHAAMAAYLVFAG